MAALTFLVTVPAVALNLIVQSNHLSGIWYAILILASCAAVAGTFPVATAISNLYRDRLSRKRLASQFISRNNAALLAPWQDNRIPLTLSVAPSPYNAEGIELFRDVGIEDSKHALSLPDNRLIELIKPGSTLAIIGEWGSGKTSLLIQLSRQLAERAIQDFDQPAPILISLPQFRYDGEQTDLEEIISITSGRSPTAVMDWFRRGSVVLLFDDIDRLAAEDMHKFATKLVLLREKYPELCIVYTLGSIGDDANILLSQTSAIVTMPPLTYRQVKDLLDRLVEGQLIPADAAEILLRMIQSRPGLSGFTRNPRYIRLMLAAVERTENVESMEGRIEEALAAYSVENRDIESAEHAFRLSSEGFSYPLTTVLQTSEISPTERKILQVLRPDVTYDLAQVISATSLNPSAASQALNTLIDKGSVLRISADPEPRYVAVAQSQYQ